MYGRGVILKVNLSTEEITKEEIPEELCRKYIGGEGINSRLLWEHFLSVDPQIDPTSEQNILIFGIGPLAGTAYGAGSKARWTFKGPAYNMFGDSTSGGAFVCQMRWAGYDHLVVTGRAKRPIYIRIEDDTVELRDASRLWGKKVRETDQAIKEELRDGGVETACIGPAGENMVTYAAITVSCERIAGRTGGGCVFGSKNLKAVAARGTKGINVYKPKTFFQHMDDQLAALYRFPERREFFKKYGSTTLTVPFNALGWNAFRNSQGGQLPDWALDKLSAQWWFFNIGERPISCSPGCAAPCQYWYRIKGSESPAARKYSGDYGMRPEYGALIPFGGACDIRDFPAVTRMVSMCNEYGLDTFEVGLSISFVMELYQRGIVTQKDVAQWMGEPLLLEWGDYESVEKIIEAIALQRNEMGRILKRGVYRAAKTIEELKGIPVLQYAHYGKGGATHCESLRSRPSLAMACAVAAIGAHHLKGHSMDQETSNLYFGTPDAANPLTPKLKGAAHALAEFRSAWRNSLGGCAFGGGGYRDFVSFPAELFVGPLYALTGMKMTSEEIWMAGKRIVNLEKAFNSRLGLRRVDDSLCERVLNEPMPDGVGMGMKAGDWLESAKDEYYDYHGWDKATGLQRREKLKEMGLEDVIEVLERESAVI